MFTWPIPGYTLITSHFGMRTHPITGVYKLHSGTDVSLSFSHSAYLSVGAKMAEGDFSSYKYKKQTSYNNKNKSMQNTEYLNNIRNLQKGAENEFKGKNEEWN